MRPHSLTLFFALLLSACAGLGGEPEIVATVRPPAEPTPVISAESWRPDIAAGARLFARHCTDCHGVDGAGQGDLVLAGSIPPPIDMTDLELVGAKSPLEWYDIITHGLIENLMPPWQNALSDAERWDVALYTYTLGYTDDMLARGESLWRERCADCAPPVQIPPVFSDADYARQLAQMPFAPALSQAELKAAVAYARVQSLEARPVDATAAELPGVIRGRVEQGTAGSALPPDLAVQLQFGDSAAGISRAETVAAADGSFSFADIPLTDEFTYVISAAYAGRLFNLRLPAGFSQDDVAIITVYDAAHDPFVVSVSRIDLIVEALNLDGMGRGVYVSQIIRYRNDSDRLYTSGRGFDDGREAVLLLQFPDGARLLSNDAAGRYIVIEGIESLPDSVIDTLPLPPGDFHEVALQYFFPDEDGLRFEQDFNNVVDAEVSIALGPGLEVESDWLRLAESSSGRAVYRGQLSQTVDPRLSFGISGAPFESKSFGAAVISSESLPALMLIGGAALALALGAGYALRRRRRSEETDDADALLRQLAQLDAEHESGQINHDLWHHQRRALKARLAALMAADE